MADKKTKKPAAKPKAKVDDLIGKRKKPTAPKKPKAKKVVKDDLDDLIGAVATRATRKVVKDDLDDLIGTPRPMKPADIAVGEVSYNPLGRPKVPHPEGLWARREAKGKNWGVTCLECNEPLKWIGGRPPVVCKKKECFRAYRNLYRRDYEKREAAERKKAVA